MRCIPLRTHHSYACALCACTHLQHAHSGIDSNNARNAGIDCHSIRQVGSGTARKDERENDRASERGTMHPNGALCGTQRRSALLPRHDHECAQTPQSFIITTDVGETTTLRSPPMHQLASIQNRETRGSARALAKGLRAASSAHSSSGVGLFFSNREENWCLLVLVQ